jgi:hypothetical protein
MSNDNGLVDEYEKLQKSKVEIENQLDLLKQKIISLSKEKETKILFGKNKKCIIHEYDKVIYPEDKTNLISTLKKIGKYEYFSTVNYLRLSSSITKKEIEIPEIKIFKDYRVSIKEI